MLPAQNVDHIEDAEHEGNEPQSHKESEDVPEEKNEVNVKEDPSPSPEPEPTPDGTTKTPSEITMPSESSAFTLPLSVLTVLILLAL